MRSMILYCLCANATGSHGLNSNWKFMFLSAWQQFITKPNLVLSYIYVVHTTLTYIIHEKHDNILPLCKRSLPNRAHGLYSDWKFMFPSAWQQYTNSNSVWISRIKPFRFMKFQMEHAIWKLQINTIRLIEIELQQVTACNVNIMATSILQYYEIMLHIPGSKICETIQTFVALCCYTSWARLSISWDQTGPGVGLWQLILCTLISSCYQDLYICRWVFILSAIPWAVIPWENGKRLSISKFTTQFSTKQKKMDLLP